ncbi:NADP-dependent oxidoreductase, partial [Motilibacter sp. E257]|nr:NADP-dependent oxidoreductase [Motilibacter deserti]
MPRTGGPEVLEIVELPVPQPGPGELRIRVTAATVNPTDVGLREMGADLPTPWVPGMELAGVVDEVGEGVTLPLGTPVMAIVSPRRPQGGGQAELVAVPQESVAPVPEETSDVEAATLPMNGLTARLALDRLALPAGATLGVTGAAGALGGYVMQLAKVEGLRVVADAKPEDEPLVRELGADEVVPRSDDPSAAYRRAVPVGLDAVVDTALLHEEVLGAVRDGGGLVTVRGWSGPSERGIVVHPVLVREYLHEQAKLAELGALVEQGRLTLRV